MDKLPNIMHGFPSQSDLKINIGPRTIPVRIAGTGMPILFLHGYPLDHRMWESVMGELKENYLCIAPDFRGFGRSEEERKSFSMGDLADDCARLLGELQIRQPVVLCGLSMGGYVAMEFIDQNPGLVASVILANTRCNAEDAPGAATRRAIAHNVLKLGVPSTVAPMMEKLVCRTTMEHDKAVVDAVNAMMLQTRASTIAWAQLAMSRRQDFTERLKTWQVPAFCIGGEFDPITPPSVVENMSRSIPNSRFKIIERAAHLTPLEQSTEFVNAVRQFLSSSGCD